MLPYSPLHHLLAADTAHDARDDERQRVRRADRLPRRRRARAPGRHRRPRPARTTARSTRAPTTRSCAPSAAAPLMLRRSRGHVPEALALPARRAASCWPAAPSSRARSAWPRARARVGRATTSATCATRRRCAPSPRASRTSSGSSPSTPEVVAHDLHPDYLSTTYALAREGVAHVGVQHHHAHLAAVLAEHGERGPAIGAIYDGTGYGTDGTVWGGELLAGGLDGFERAGHLWPVRLPGGDRAVRQPWRMACAWLVEVQGAEPVAAARDRAAHLARGRRARAHRARRAADDEHGPALRRRRRAVRRCAPRSPTRARRRSSSRRSATAPSAAPIRSTSPAACSTRAGRSPPSRCDVAAGVERVAGRGALPSRGRARHRAGVRRGRRRARPGHRRARRRRVAEPPAARAHDAAARATRGLRVLVPERLPPNDGAISFGQAAVAARARALSPPTR